MVFVILSLFFLIGNYMGARNTEGVFKIIALIRSLRRFPVCATDVWQRKITGDRKVEWESLLEFHLT